MRSEELKGEIGAMITPVLEELTAELIELGIKKRGDTIVLDVIADKSNGGITLDECLYINKQILKKLDQGKPLGEDYAVEVSSPGLDRALKNTKDFMRVRDRNVRFHLTQAVENKIEHQGRVVDVAGNLVSIISQEKTITIPLEVISKAVQVI